MAENNKKINWSKETLKTTKAERKAWKYKGDEEVVKHDAKKALEKWKSNVQNDSWLTKTTEEDEARRLAMNELLGYTNDNTQEKKNWFKVPDGMTHDEFMSKQNETNKASWGAARAWAGDIGNSVSTLMNAAEDIIASKRSANANDPEYQAYAAKMEALHPGYTSESLSARNKVIASNIQNRADKLSTSGTELMQANKNSMQTGVGRVASDIISNATQMGLDAASQPILGRWTSFFLRAAGGSAREARMDGATAQQQLAYGALKGSIEVGTEKLYDGVAGIFGKGVADEAVDQLIKRLAGSDAGEMALKLVASFSGEAIEEMLSDLADPFAKKFTYSPETPISYDVSELLYDGLVGGLLGALGLGAESITGLSQYQGNAQALLDNQQYLTDETTKSRFADAQSKYDSTGKMTNLTAERLAANAQSDITKSDTETIRSAVLNRLTEMGETESVEELASAITKQVMGEKVKSSEAKMIQDSKYGRSTAAQLNISNILTDGLNADWVKNIGTKVAGGRLYGSEMSQAKPSTLKVSNNNKTTDASGKEINIAKIASIGKDGMTLTTADGQTIKASDVRFASNSEAYAYEAISRMGLRNAENANEVLQIYRDSGLDADVFARAAMMAVKYGETGQHDSLMQSKDGLTGLLNKSTREALYNIGASIGTEKVSSAQASVNSKVQKAKVGNGKIIIEAKSDPAGYNAKQRTGIQTAEALSGMTGRDVHIFESYKKNGSLYYTDAEGKEVKAPNGFIDENGDIWLDLKSGNDGEGIILNTYAHELTHFIKMFAPEKFQVFAEYLFNEISKQTGSKFNFEDTLRSYTSRGMTTDLAIEEMVADACDTMLQNGNAQAVFAELQMNKDLEKEMGKDFWSKLKKFVSKLLGQLKQTIDAYKGVGSQTSMGRLVQGMESSYETIQKMWAEALSEAADVSRMTERASEVTINENATVEDISNSEERVAVEELGENTDVEVNSDGELVLATNEENSIIMYSERTYHRDGRDRLIATLTAKGYNKTQIDEYVGYLDGALDYLTLVAAEVADSKGYHNLAEHLEMDIVTNPITGRQILSALVNNGEYPVNFDLSLLCKKRIAYMKVMEALITDGVMNKVNYGAKAIAKVNEILRKHGFETACLGCFVESRRLQLQAWAETICEEWNAEVDKLVDNAESFNFYEKEDHFSRDEINSLVLELEAAGKKRGVNDKGNITLGKGNSVTKMARLLKEVPSLRKHLRVVDLLTPKGLSMLREYDSNLFSIVKSRYGAASPKFVQEFNPYASEIDRLTFKFAESITGNAITGAQKYRDAVTREVLGVDAPVRAENESRNDFDKRVKEYKALKKSKEGEIEDAALREYLYSIGGGRMQSFSDFMIENTFDMLQLTADAAAKEFPLHGYTKEQVCLRLFGMTGEKWNGSFIAHVDPAMGKQYAGLLEYVDDGSMIKVEYDGKTYGIGVDDVARNIASGNKSYIQSIGMKDVIAIQLDPRYSANVGTITIGVSDAQIYAMLDNDYFRMIIPYHKSGMNPIYAHLMGIENYNDYEEFQNTSIKQLYDMDGTPIDGYGREYVADKEYRYNAKVQELYDKGSADAPREAADDYIAWCKDHKQHPVYAKEKVNNAYVQLGWADFNPKFSTVTHNGSPVVDFSQHRNYYKLLEDFNMYDGVTGSVAIQRAVTMNFPSAENALKGKELEQYKKRLKAVGIFTDAEIESYAKKAQMSFKEIAGKEINSRADYESKQREVYDSAVSEIKDVLLNSTDEEGNPEYLSTPEERSAQRKAERAKSKPKGKKKKSEREQELADAAVDYFGTTNNFKDAGFMLTDGRLLNFNNKDDRLGYGDIWYDDMAPYGDNVDHIAVSRIYDDSGYDYDDPVLQFIDDGNVRIMSEWRANESGVQLSKSRKPSEAQMEGILRMADEAFSQGKTFVIGYGYGESEFFDKSTDPNRIRSNINYYYTNGKVRDGVSRFLYSERDNEYSKAVQSGDMDTAQQMVNEAAKEAGFTTGLYHGTDANFTVFDKSRKANGKTFGNFIYLTDNRDSAKSFATDTGKVMELAAKLGNTLELDLTSDKTTNEVRKVLGLRANAKITYSNIKSYISYMLWNDKYLLRDHSNDTPAYDSVKISNSWDANGNRFTEYLVNNENQVKSMDPVTYDDNGNVIPLSERFSESKDTRYSERDREAMAKKAEEHFGITNNAMESGYITINGNYLDFSGRHWGGNNSGSRQVDHADVNEILPENFDTYKITHDGKVNRSGSMAMWEFEKYGFIRTQPETGSIELAVMPTEDQFMKLKNYFKKMKTLGYSALRVELNDLTYEGKLYPVKTLKYGMTESTEAIVLDIENYYKNGKLPEGYIPYGESTKNSWMFSERYDGFSNRELLAEALEDTALTKTERNYIKDYQRMIGTVDVAEMQIEKINRDLQTETDPDRITFLKNELKVYADRIDRYDQKLFKLIATEPMKKYLDRKVQQAIAKEHGDAVAARNRMHERYRADRAALVQRMTEDKRTAVAEVRQTERERADQRVLKQKQHDLEVRQRADDKRNENAGRNKYKKQVQEKVQRLTDWLLKNSDKEHIPENLKAPLLEFITAINFDSKSKLSSGKETKADEKFAARLLKLEQMLRSQQDALDGDENAIGFDVYVDLPGEAVDFLKDMSAKVTDALNRGEVFTVNTMTAAELMDLSNFLSAITTSIRQMNNLLANERYKSIREAADQDIADMQKLGRVKDSEGKRLVRFLKWEDAVPFFAMKRFGKGGASIFESITKGWEKFAFNAKQIIDFADKTYTKKEVNEWKNDIRTAELEDGSEIRISIAQIMALKCLLKREQAVQHIEKGGVRIGNIQVNGKTITDTTHYHLSSDDIVNLLGMLSERQSSVADKLQNYMATQGAAWGNEVSMRRFGYEFYTEGETYFPIATDANDRPMRDTDAQTNSMFRLLNLSSSKSLNPRASNALVVNDIFDVFADHMADQAKLNGLGLPILDAIKWFSYREKIDGEDGTYTTRTLQGAMEQAFGSAAQKYFKTLMKDINGVKESGDRGTGVMGSLMSNYKIAAVAANLRVALLQPTAYVRASFKISPKYLLAAFAHKNGYQEAMKYSGTAVWKVLGYYDTDISRGLRQQIEHNDTVRDVIADKSMTLAELGDQLTWGRLWVACKLQTKAQNSSLTGEALNQATADLFREVIYSSQVMDSTLTRSEVMRGNTIGTKMMTAFMAEPTLSYNILLDAYSTYENDARQYGKAEAWKRNSGGIGKAFTVYVASAAFSAVVESLADAIRDDDDEKFIDKFLQALLGEKNPFEGNLVQDLSLIGKIPVLKDLMSLIQGYEGSNMTTASFTSVIKAVKIWIETIQLANGTLEKATSTTYYGNMTAWGKVYKSLQALSQLSGIAVSNALRDATAIWNTIFNDRPDMKIRTYDDGSTEKWTTMKDIFPNKSEYDAFVEYIGSIHTTDEKTKKEQVVEYINSMKLTSAQKDRLYLASGYKDTTLDKTPWH